MQTVKESSNLKIILIYFLFLIFSIRQNKKFVVDGAVFPEDH
jgi:hypothetical protein